MHTAPDLSEESNATPCTRAEAESGDAAAQFGLAFYLAARPVPDYEQALSLYLKAADQNHHLAQLNAGRMFAEGQGTERDEEAAAKWIRRAADGGDAGAQFEMGDHYSRASSRGTEPDISESRVECYKWFKLAAAQGYHRAEDRSDFATLRMSREEVHEGERRVTAFKNS